MSRTLQPVVYGYVWSRTLQPVVYGYVGESYFTVVYGYLGESYFTASSVWCSEFLVQECVHLRY